MAEEKRQRKRRSDAGKPRKRAGDKGVYIQVRMRNEGREADALKVFNAFVARAKGNKRIGLTEALIAAGQQADKGFVATPPDVLITQDMARMLRDMRQLITRFQSLDFGSATFQQDARELQRVVEDFALDTSSLVSDGVSFFDEDE